MTVDHNIRDILFCSDLNGVKMRFTQNQKKVCTLTNSGGNRFERISSKNVKFEIECDLFESNIPSPKV